MFAVEIAPRAVGELRRVVTWWQEHSRRPELIDLELSDAIEALSIFPEVGAPYPSAKRPGVRRRLMSATQVYVYYRIIEPEQLVRILAFWHTARGNGPRL